jgi:hypothetical protein
VNILASQPIFDSYRSQDSSISSLVFAKNIDKNARARNIKISVFVVFFTIY